jgi:5-methylcytosine-specific restriction endonuclease McrA
VKKVRSAYTNNRVLVLNATYEPISFISLKRAVILVLREKAEIVEAQVERALRSERQSLEAPLVIRLVVYVPVPRYFNIPLTRRSLMSRDKGECQYCGTSSDGLTMDHVLPRSKGGKTEWTNVVAACVPCNRRKANRTPDQAHMPLRSKPAKPGYIAVVLLGQADNGLGNVRGRAPKSHVETWKRYIQPQLS